MGWLNFYHWLAENKANTIRLRLAWWSWIKAIMSFEWNEIKIIIQFQYYIMYKIELGMECSEIGIIIKNWNFKVLSFNLNFFLVFSFFYFCTVFSAFSLWKKKLFFFFFLCFNFFLVFFICNFFVSVFSF